MTEVELRSFKADVEQRLAKIELDIKAALHLLSVIHVSSPELGAAIEKYLAVQSRLDSKALAAIAREHRPQLLSDVIEELVNHSTSTKEMLAAR